MILRGYGGLGMILRGFGYYSGRMEQRGGLGYYSGQMRRPALAGCASCGGQQRVNNGYEEAREAVGGVGTESHYETLGPNAEAIRRHSRALTAADMANLARDPRTAPFLVNLAQHPMAGFGAAIDRSVTAAKRQATVTTEAAKVATVIPALAPIPVMPSAAPVQVLKPTPAPAPPPPAPKPTITLTLPTPPPVTPIAPVVPKPSIIAQLPVIQQQVIQATQAPAPVSAKLPMQPSPLPAAVIQLTTTPAGLGPSQMGQQTTKTTIAPSLPPSVSPITSPIPKPSIIANLPTITQGAVQAIKFAQPYVPPVAPPQTGGMSREEQVCRAQGSNYTWDASGCREIPRILPVTPPMKLPVPTYAGPSAAELAVAAAKAKVEADARAAELEAARRYAADKAAKARKDAEDALAAELAAQKPRKAGSAFREPATGPVGSPEAIAAGVAAGKEAAKFGAMTPQQQQQYAAAATAVTQQKIDAAKTAAANTIAAAKAQAQAAGSAYTAQAAADKQRAETDAALWARQQADYTAAQAKLATEYSSMSAEQMRALSLVTGQPLNLLGMAAARQSEITQPQGYSFSVGAPSVNVSAPGAAEAQAAGGMSPTTIALAAGGALLAVMLLGR